MLQRRRAPPAAGSLLPGPLPVPMLPVRVWRQSPPAPAPLLPIRVLASRLLPIRVLASRILASRILASGSRPTSMLDGAASSRTPTAGA